MHNVLSQFKLINIRVSRRLEIFSLTCLSSLIIVVQTANQISIGLEEVRKQYGTYLCLDIIYIQRYHYLPYCI